MAKSISITNARKDIYKLAEEVNEMHEEILVYNGNTGKNMIIISEEEWRGIQETLYLNSIPGFVDSVLEGKNEPIEGRTLYNLNEEW